MLRMAQNCDEAEYVNEYPVELFAPKGYVLGSEGEKNRHWWKIEFPILTNSECSDDITALQGKYLIFPADPLVQQILRVDPRPVEEGGDPCDLGGIWNRNVVPGVVPRPITWTCPTSAKIKALLAEELGHVS